MKKLAKNLLTVFLVLALTTACVSVVYSEESSEKAKQILEKTYKKYSDLVKKGDRGIRSVAAKLSIKGGAQVPMGGPGSNVPLDIDAAIEIYAEKPHRLYLGLSGNLASATIIVAGEEKVTATILLPKTKQFASIDVPEKHIREIQEPDPQKPDRMEDFLKQVILAYEGTQDTKAGKAHKIAIKGKEPSEKTSIAVYILDGKWDPTRIEVTEEGEGKLAVEFEELKLNERIPDRQFVPDTKGYTQVSEKDLLQIVMMQIMTTVMQQSTEE